MTYEEAKRVRLAGGRWEGMTLERVARSRDGLRFLRLLRTTLPEADPRYEAVRAFMEDERTRRREEWFRHTPRFIPRFAK